MAASISISRDSLVVDIEGADKLWALKSRLAIPLAHVADNPEEQSGKIREATQMAS
jgi:hypothetical protein